MENKSPAFRVIFDIPEISWGASQQGPGKLSVMRGSGSWIRYSKQSKYSPSSVRRLGVARGVGRPPKTDA